MSIPKGSYCEFYQMSCKDARVLCLEEDKNDEDIDSEEDCEYCGRCIEPEYEP